MSDTPKQCLAVTVTTSVQLVDIDDGAVYDLCEWESQSEIYPDSSDLLDYVDIADELLEEVKRKASPHAAARAIEKKLADE